jgi:hypothetical protein
MEEKIYQEVDRDLKRPTKEEEVALDLIKAMELLG